MQLIDPTGTPPARNHQCAPRLDSLNGKVVGLLSNGKLNADRLLLETAALFEAHQGCTTTPITYKANPSAPAPEETLAQLATQADFLLTATGD